MTLNIRGICIWREYKYGVCDLQDWGWCDVDNQWHGEYLWSSLSFIHPSCTACCGGVSWWCCGTGAVIPPPRTTIRPTSTTSHYPMVIQWTYPGHRQTHHIVHDIVSNSDENLVIIVWHPKWHAGEYQGDHHSMLHTHRGHISLPHTVTKPIIIIIIYEFWQHFWIRTNTQQKLKQIFQQNDFYLFNQWSWFFVLCHLKSCKFCP